MHFIIDEGTDLSFRKRRMMDMGSYEEFLENEKDRGHVEEYDIERDFAALNQKESSLAAKVRGFFSRKEDSADEVIPEEETGTVFSQGESGHVEPACPGCMELVPGEPPEEPPARRTSDEQIEAMLASVTGEAVPEESEAGPFEGEEAPPEENYEEG